MTERDTDARGAAAIPSDAERRENGDENGEFDALQFLENFIQQHHTPSSSRPTSAAYRNSHVGLPSPGTPVSPQPNDDGGTLVIGSTVPRGFRYQEPPEEPPPPYNDIDLPDNPRRNSSILRGPQVNDFPPRYDEVKHIFPRNEDNDNSRHSEARGFVAPEVVRIVQPGDNVPNIWSRYDYSSRAERAPLSARSPPNIRSNIEPQDKPSNCMILAVLVTLFCFCPLGIFAIWQAKKANQATKRGNYSQGKSRALEAKILIFGTILFGLVVYTFLIGYIKWTNGLV